MERGLDSPFALILPFMERRDYAIGDHPFVTGDVSNEV